MICEDCGVDLGIGEDTPDAGDLFRCNNCYVWIDALAREATGDERDTSIRSLAGAHGRSSACGSSIDDH